MESRKKQKQRLQTLQDENARLQDTNQKLSSRLEEFETLNAMLMKALLVNTSSPPNNMTSTCDNVLQNPQDFNSIYTPCFDLSLPILTMDPNVSDPAVVMLAIMHILMVHVCKVILSQQRMRGSNPQWTQCWPPPLLVSHQMSSI